MYANPISSIRPVDGHLSVAPLSAKRRLAGLANAIVQRDLDAVRVSLQEDPTLIHMQDEHGDTPLHIALRTGAGLDLVDLLLDYRPDVTKTNDHSDTCMHVLLGRRPPAPQLVDRLLERGKWRTNSGLGAMRLVNEDGRNALQMAEEADGSIVSGYKETIAALTATLKQCQAGIQQSVLAALKAGDTHALSQIITSMQWEVESVVVEGLNVVQLAMLSGNMENITAVLDLVAKSGNARALDVWTAPVNGGPFVLWSRDRPGQVSNLEDFTAALDGLAPSRRTGVLDMWPQTAIDEFGMAPLIWAIGHGDTRLVTRLLALGADVNLRALGELTALHVAAALGNCAMVKVLLDHGALPDCRTDLGRTPLMNAAVKGSMDIVRLLQKRGADINAADDLGNTALLLALETQPDDFLARLVEAGAGQDVLVTDTFDLPVLIDGRLLRVEKQIRVHVDIDLNARKRACTLL